MPESAKKSALITGAATGIGRSIAETLAAQGVRVAINHPHTPDLADEVVAKIEADGSEALAVAADVRDGAEYSRQRRHGLAGSAETHGSPGRAVGSNPSGRAAGTSSGIARPRPHRWV
ncbi:SDR family NAD(P)-dependent oxidoreductase [Nocardia sp. CDC153]|uniref:SDR family NAD(P)-dependent oxidoreductase n=1 Tax=Nocardia sp. CDC153 TaxID=3112167 RepID=UPI002DBF911E|nr:SDR family NAD(P)-dependent oxidoreductase [Nocardia sp. CDC153]MEC3951750.1 SDR family NAD(P)-dependent oxidoreductase [Nocardia sp. CDC153]